MASNTTENKITHYTTDLVFRGKDYSSWRSRMFSLLECEDYDDLLDASSAEDEYVNRRDGTSSSDQTEAQKAYAKRQAKAKNLIYNHMDTPYYRLIRYCSTVREIFERLDDDFFTRTDSGIVQLRKEMTAKTFDGKTTIDAFIDDYEHRCEAYIDAGGELSSTDWVHQLHGALPLEFDSAIDWFSSLPSYKRTYYAYRNKVLEKARRLKASATIPSSVPSSSSALAQPKNQPTSTTGNASSSASNSNESPRPRCPHCRYRGHSAKDCYRLKARNEALSEDAKPRPDGKQHMEGKNTDDKPQPKPEPKEDWSKFKNLPKKDDPKDKDPKRFLACVAHVNTENTTRDHYIPPSPSHCHVFPAHSQPVLTPPIELEQYDAFMLLDSGTAFHLTNELSDLVDVADAPTTYYIHGIDSANSLKATKIGNMHVSLENIHGTEHETMLRNVLYVPDLSTKLLSVIRITASDEFGVLFRATETRVFDTETGDVLMSAARSSNQLSWFRFKRVRNSVSAMPALPTMTVQLPSNIPSRDTPVDQLQLWHRRLGHINAKYMRWALNMTTGLPPLKIIDEAFAKCTTCIQAKSTRLPHSSSRTRPTRRFELICSDICDAKCTAVTGHKMFLTFIDAFSGYTKIIPIKSKSEVPTEFAQFHKWITNRFPNDPVATLRCDGAREYIAGDTQRYCNAAGILIDSGCPFTPQLNGLAERKNRTIIEKIRVLLLDACLSVEYWPFAAKTAVHILNRAPCKTNTNNQTPYELIFDSKPDLQHFRVFGCMALRHLPPQVRARDASQRRYVNMSKLGPAATFTIMFGYSNTGYELLEYDNHRLITSRDVRFIESENILSFQQKDTVTTDDATLSNTIPEDTPVDVTEGTADPHEPVNVTEGTDDPIPDDSSVNIVDNTPLESVDIEFPDNDLTSDLVPSIVHSALDPVTEVGAMLATVKSKWNRPVVLLSDHIPKHYNDAITCTFASAWIEAMEREFLSHAENGTWHVVPRSEAKHLIRTLWVYTTKIDNDGNDFAKARLVAFGCADPTRYENKDVYAAVCPIEIIRLTLSFAVKFGFSMTTMDVTTAFLYGQIETDVYLSIPQGLDLDRTKYALKLDKAIYGLKISSKLWHDTLRSALFRIGYVNSVCERCLYFFRREHELAILITYVDDLMLISNSTHLAEYTIFELASDFRMKINRSPTQFIGLQFHYQTDVASMTISQSDYISQLARKFNIVETRVYYTPLECTTKLIKNTTIVNDDREYRAYVGALLYLARFSRPDIAFAVHSLSTLQGHVDSEVKSAARRVLKYVIGTKHLSLTYTDSNDDTPWRAFVDASHATEKGLKSISGFALFHFGNIVDWSTKKQPIIAVSSTAAEVIAVASYLDNMLIPRALFQEIFGYNTVIEVFEDNTSAIYAFDGGQNRNLRWTLIKAHAVVEAIQNGYLHLNFVPSSLQLADGFTKALSRPKFEQLRHYFLRETP